MTIRMVHIKRTTVEEDPARRCGQEQKSRATESIHIESHPKTGSEQYPGAKHRTLTINHGESTDKGGRTRYKVREEKQIFESVGWN